MEKSLKKVLQKFEAWYPASEVIGPDKIKKNRSMSRPDASRVREKTNEVSKGLIKRINPKVLEGPLGGELRPERFSRSQRQLLE